MKEGRGDWVLLALKLKTDGQMAMRDGGNSRMEKPLLFVREYHTHDGLSHSAEAGHIAFDRFPHDDSLGCLRLISHRTDTVKSEEAFFPARSADLQRFEMHGNDGRAAALVHKTGFAQHSLRLLTKKILAKTDA